MIAPRRSLQCARAHSLTQAVKEQQPVRQAGEGVVMRQPVQMGLRALGDRLQQIVTRAHAGVSPSSVRMKPSCMWRMPDSMMVCDRSSRSIWRSTINGVVSMNAEIGFLPKSSRAKGRAKFSSICLRCTIPEGCRRPRPAGEISSDCPQTA